MQYQSIDTKIAVPAKYPWRLNTWPFPWMTGMSYN